jgi:uncharacterized membrane protein
MSPFLILHIAAGSLAFATGSIALLARKGATVHRRVGMVFFVSMLVMSTSALYLSILHQPGTIFSSIFTFYLAATAWATVRKSGKSTGLFERAAFAFVLCCLAGLLYSAYQANIAPNHEFLGYSTPVYIFLLGLVSLAAAGDLRLLLRGGIAGAQRIARHLWRTCVALFFAVASSLTQLQKVLPAHVSGIRVLYVLLILAVMPLFFLAYWMVRVRFTRWWIAQPSAA